MCTKRRIFVGGFIFFFSWNHTPSCIVDEACAPKLGESSDRAQSIKRVLQAPNKAFACYALVVSIPCRNFFLTWKATTAHWMYWFTWGMCHSICVWQERDWIWRIRVSFLCVCVKSHDLPDMSQWDSIIFWSEWPREDPHLHWSPKSESYARASTRMKICIIRAGTFVCT
jgi:hypothetical protein